MTDPMYSEVTTLTALPPETARRQFLRCAVFIDGNNWYNRLRELLNNSIDPTKLVLKPSQRFDVRGLCTALVSPEQLTSISYYKGIVQKLPGDKRSEKMYADEQRLFTFLRNHQSIQLSFGRIIRHPDGSFHEKGVDLRLAIDMIKMAVSDSYDVAYLMSSDNDLVPAIEECRLLKKEVVYVGSSLKPSFGLQKASNRSILLQQKDVLPFMPPQQPLLPQS